MWLPIPSAEHVERFRTLIRAEFELELREEESLQLADNLLQIYFLLPYANRAVRPEINRKRRPPSSEP